jgi:glycosyltransferase involved in cell wall biosynthesis
VRLLIATDQWSPDVVGGAARVATNTAHALAQRGHEIVVVSPQQPGLPGIEHDGLLELRRSLWRGFLPQTFSDVFEGWRAGRRAGADFDLLVAHQNTLASGLAAARLGIPLALVFHSSIPLEQRFRRRRLPVAQRLMTLALNPALVGIERAAVRAATGVLVLSEFSKDILLRVHPRAAGRVTTVTGGIDPAGFEPQTGRRRLRESLGLAGSGPLLVSVRRLEPRMGIEELLHAAALLREQGIDFTLAIAGDGALATSLRALADELGLGPHVAFLGRISEADLKDLYAAADLSVLPTVAYEGFGMSTVESLASGTPVVGTAVGATPELLASLDRDLVATSADPRDLAAAVARTLPRLDEDFRLQCATYARARYAWDTVIVDWERAFERIAGKPARADGEGI